MNETKIYYRHIINNKYWLIVCSCLIVITDSKAIKMAKLSKKKITINSNYVYVYILFYYLKLFKIYLRQTSI